MKILHKDSVPTINGNRVAYTISCTDKIIKVECDSIYQGDGWGFVIDKRYIPDINADNSIAKINSLLEYKQTKKHRHLCVKQWTKNVPFMVADDPNSGNKAVMI